MNLKIDLIHLVIIYEQVLQIEIFHLLFLDFGIVGSGKCYVLELAPNGQIIPVTSFYTKDGLYVFSFNILKLGKNQCNRT